jgi:hypothetical protein
VSGAPAGQPRGLTVADRGYISAVALVAAIVTDAFGVPFAPVLLASLAGWLAGTAINGGRNRRT